MTAVTVFDRQWVWSLVMNYALSGVCSAHLSSGCHFVFLFWGGSFVVWVCFFNFFFKEKHLLSLLV